MSSQRMGWPVDCIDRWRSGKRFVGQFAWVAAAAVIVFCRLATAQTATLTPGVATGAISCAPSNNNTAHMVCLEYSTSGTLIGLSWEAPPTSPPSVPVPPVAGGGKEAVGKIDVSTTPPLATPGGALVGAPGCGPENDGNGTIACLVISKATSGTFILQGIAFYPPTDNAGGTMPSVLKTLATEPANIVIGNPSCTTAGVANAVVCAITIDGHLFGVGFEPKANISTALSPLLSGAAVTGNPSCASGENGVAIPSACAVREGNSLVGFALTFVTSPTASIASEDAIFLGSMAFAGDPNCAIPPNGQVGTTSFVATCGIVSGTTLFGLSFDPIDAIPVSSPSVHTTAFQSLGTAPDAGSWTGSVGCSGFPDFRRGADPNPMAFPNASPNQNLMSCVAISSTDNVFEVTFDPRLPVSRGVVGPFGGNANATLSCLPLAIDHDSIYCGGTTTAGASAGYTVPVGVLSPTAASILQRFGSD
jgi:hypothetical protein